MKKEVTKRNAIISLFKFIFSIVIVIYHGKKLVGINKFEIATLGYFCVDFFFIVSGYYFYKNILKLNEKKNLDIYKENVKMIITKLKRFLPYTIISGLLAIILFYIMKELKITNALMSIFNLFLIDMVGLKGYTINGPIWYISSMLIIFFILCPIIYKLKDKYIYYICPLIIMFGLGYMYNKYSTLNLHRSKWNGFLFSGTIKALVEINIGILLYNISNKIKEVLNKKNNIIMYLLNIAYILGYIFILLFMLFYKKSGVLDYFVLLVISITLLLNFSDEIFSIKLDSKFTRYLEKISLPIFVNHFMFLNYFYYIGKRYTMDFYKYLILYVSCTIVFSIIEQFIIDLLKSRKVIKEYGYEKK